MNTEGKTNEIFDSAVANAVLGVPGVAEIKGCTLNDLPIESGSDEKTGDVTECDLDLRLSIEYGSSIPAILENIQKKLREDIKAATGLEVRNLCLCVEDIHHIPRETNQGSVIS